MGRWVSGLGSGGRIRLRTEFCKGSVSHRRVVRVQTKKAMILESRGIHHPYIAAKGGVGLKGFEM